MEIKFTPQSMPERLQYNQLASDTFYVCSNGTIYFHKLIYSRGKPIEQFGVLLGIGQSTFGFNWDFAETHKDKTFTPYHGTITMVCP